MTNTKTYTLNDIGRKLDAMDGRLIAVENWKEKLEWTKSAVDEYKKQEQDAKSQKIKANLWDKLNDAGPYLLAIVVAVAVFLIIYSTRTK